jgi:hypothetical protein
MRPLAAESSESYAQADERDGASQRALQAVRCPGVFAAGGGSLVRGLTC